jgi:hypothetical protein
MMNPAQRQRHHKFIADLAARGSRLDKIAGDECRRSAAAQQSRSMLILSAAWIDSQIWRAFEEAGALLSFAAAELSEMESELTVAAWQRR